MKNQIKLVISACLFLLVISQGISFGYPGGISGRTLKGSSPGCTCHTSSPSSSVVLTISGPSTLTPGQTADYQVMMTYTSTISGGGMDIAASKGTLVNSDSHLKVLNAELTQPSAQNVGTSSYAWKFKYTAPATAGTQTLYATGCAVKNSWNNASNFTITVKDPSTDVSDNNNSVKDFYLAQNFPNPFNPTTAISYNLKEAGLVTLKVYNAEGREVATLVNKNQEAGNHTVNFNSVGLSSGVYLYTLKSGNNAAITRKMILLK